MIRSRLSGARCGVSVHDTDSEGQKFYDSIVEDVSIGAERLTTEPTFQWMGCRITAEQTGLYLWGVRDTVFAGSVFEATAPDAKTIIMEHDTLQHLAFRGNILLGANTLTVPSVDYDGANSKRVDSVTFSGNYIQGADPVFDLSGSETYGFSLGGNMLKDTGQEFVVAPDTTLIFKTQTEEIQ